MARRRIEKLNSLIQEEISKIIHKEIHVKDTLITVLEVETTNDLKYTNILISVFPYDKTKLASETFQKAAFKIQGLLNKKLNIKVLPRIRFKFSETGKILDNIKEAFKKIKNEN